MKKIFAFKSIKNQLIFWFLIIALLPLSVALLVTYSQRANDIEARTFSKLTAIRDLKVEQLNSWLYERIGDLNVITEVSEIKNLEKIFDKKIKSKDDKRKIEDANKLLSRVLKNYHDYEEVFIVGANTGKIELSSNPNFVGVDKSDNPYFTIPLKTKRLHIKDIYYSKSMSRLQMTFSAPIFCLTHGEHIIGILVVRINLNNSLFDLLANRVGLGKTGETLIVNKDFMALNQLRWKENAPLKLKIKAEPAVKAANGGTGITTTTDYRNEKILAAYTYIPETGWGFVCKQDIYELHAPIRQMIFDFIILFVLSAIVIYLVAFFIGKTISKPIIGLDIVTKKITAGEYSVINVVNSDDELGSLANSINEMTDSIESNATIQNGVYDIASTIIAQSSIEDFAKKLLKHLMKITNSDMSSFYILNESLFEFKHFSSIGMNQELLQSFNAKEPEGEFGNAISKKKIHYLRDIPADSIFKYKTTTGDIKPKEIITIPILVENKVIALISLVSLKGFSKESFTILEQSWLSINSSYSTLVSDLKTRTLADNLSKSNQRLEAQTEELQEQSEELQSQRDELQQSSMELQEQNLELEMQRKQIEVANKLKSEFLSNMSHELRTPLNSIMALSRVLIMQATDKLTEEENEYLEIVERNGKQLLALINDILDLSKIEAGRMDLTPSVFSIDSSLNIIKENLASLAIKKNIELKLTTDGVIPKIETDEGKITQIFSNLIGNAIKFTEKGEVTISVSADSENIFITVQDSGIGISQDALPFIFDEFRQADGSPSRRYEGTGLGLAIAKRLITILNGSIKVESKLEVGSKFIVTIPIKWDGEIDSIELLETTPIISEKSQNIKTNNLKSDPAKMRILMIEDNESAVIQIKTILSTEGYNLDVANGGQEALDYVKHTIPDGIILDLMMPDVDGFAVLENIRGTEKTRNIPVLILTAKDLSKNDLAKLSANNIQQLIHKGDVDKKDLLQKIKLMLNSEPIEKSINNDSEVNAKNIITNNPQSNKKVVNENSELPNVLVIEDNPDNMITVSAILKNRYNIIKAYDGDNGLEKAMQFLPNIILLDMSLPKMDGIEVVKALKEKSETKSIPVIALTAHAMKEDRETFLNAGCDDYISKPIDSEVILKKLSEWLQKST